MNSNSIAKTVKRGSPFHVMTKPVGPICNLNCKYCFYLEKKALYPSNAQFRMPDDVLESYIRQYIEDQDVPVAYGSLRSACPPRGKTEASTGALLTFHWSSVGEHLNLSLGRFFSHGADSALHHQQNERDTGFDQLHLLYLLAAGQSHRDRSRASMKALSSAWLAEHYRFIHCSPAVS